jgi:acyl carrier protein
MSNEEVIQGIVEILESTTGESVVSPDANLLEDGILDSLALVDVVVQIESTFSVQISFDELELEDIESVRSLARVVEAARAPGIRAVS